MLHHSIANGRRIRQARELCGFRQADLAAKIGVSQGFIAHLEGSSKLATPDIVHKIAIHTKKLQPSFFYREPVIELRPQAVPFRDAAPKSRSKQTEARLYVELVCEMAEILLRTAKPPEFRLDRVASYNPRDAARRVRGALQLAPSEPIGHVLREVEKSGVLVLVIPIDLVKKDAFTLWCERIKMPIIVFSDGLLGDRIRESAAHEFGHNVLKHSKMCTAIEQQQAGEFAAEFLMPEMAMRREMTVPITFSTLSALKARWRVSIRALIRRGKELGIIDESRARYLNVQVSVKGRQEHEPVRVPVERPRLLRQLAERTYGRNLRLLADELGYQLEFLRDILTRYDAHQAGEHEFPAKVIALRKQ